MLPISSNHDLFFSVSFPFRPVHSFFIHLSTLLLYTVYMTKSPLCASFILFAHFYTQPILLQYSFIFETSLLNHTYVFHSYCFQLILYFSKCNNTFFHIRNWAEHTFTQPFSFYMKKHLFLTTDHILPIRFLPTSENLKCHHLFLHLEKKSFW